jgi:hypothetical protein
LRCDSTQSDQLREVLKILRVILAVLRTTIAVGCYPGT